MKHLYKIRIHLQGWTRSIPPFLRIIGLIILFFIPALACEDVKLVDPTRIVPTDLSNQDFTGEYMVAVDLSHKILRGVNFTSADLRSTDFSYSDCTGVIFNNALLRNANFTGAKLDVKWARIIDLVTTGQASGRDLRGYDLSSIRISDVDFSGADLRNADLTKSRLWGGNFRNADLTGANLSETDLLKATLNGAKVTVEQLNAARLSCTQLPDGTIAQKQECGGTTPESWQN
jgi:uncharacterized protein YjbI with pentapeptide repeats